MKAIPYTLHLSIALVLFALVAHRPSQTNFSKITVEEFEMVDSRGIRRASIKVEEGGEIVFRMMDQQGSIRVKMGASEQGSALVLLDDVTEPVVHMLAKKEKSTITLTVNGKRRDL